MLPLLLVSVVVVSASPFSPLYRGLWRPRQCLCPIQNRSTGYFIEPSGGFYQRDVSVFIRCSVVPAGVVSHGVTHLELASIKSPTEGLMLRPPRVMGNEYEPIFRRLDLIAARAASRVEPALFCQWQALPGGGRTFVARTSKTSAMWRAGRIDAVAELRLHADWAGVMAA